MIGTSLSHFKITAKLGEGGMGEVYRAEDSKLGREVAIKVLPEAVASDPERLARFEREAKVVASLNHPNIAAIYQVEEAEGVHFLVMELVEGEDLRERIKRGAIATADALPVASQMAQALEAAHEKGVIHRDLKPANVRITADGQVKVLDFGLAKALDPTAGDEGSSISASPAALSLSPTLTQQMTSAGIILGTAAYMSPEQAKGETVDKRADIWSFGLVVFEMLTGRTLFAADSVAETLAGVIKTEIDFTQLPSDLPTEISRLLRRCLERDAKNRLHDVADARIVIEDVLAGRTEEGPVTEVASRHPKPIWERFLPYAMAVLGLSIGVLAIWRPWAGDVQAQALDSPVQFAIQAPKDTFLVSGLDISPDGRKVGFVAKGEDGQKGLWVRSLDSLEALRLSGTNGAHYPFWSPDSRRIGFFAEGRLKVTDLIGSTPQTLATVGASTFERGGTWGADDVIVYAPTFTGSLFRISPGGGDPEVATEIRPGSDFGTHRFPTFLPDGRHFVFYAASGSGTEPGTLMLGQLGNVESKMLGPSNSRAVFAEPDDLLYVRGETLVAHRIDLESQEFVGEPEVLGISLSGSISVSGHRSLAQAGGILVHRNDTRSDTRLVWTDRSGRELGEIGGGLQAWQYAPRISPDGRYVGVATFEPTAPNGDLWVHDLERNIASPFQPDEGDETMTAWSPSGDRIAYESIRSGEEYLILVGSVDHPSQKRVVHVSKTHPGVEFWTADGLTIGFSRPDENGEGGMWLLSLEEGAEPVPLFPGPGTQGSAHLSLDGEWLTYSSDETRRFEVYVRRLDGSGSVHRISSGGGSQPLWSGDGRELFYVNSVGEIVAVPVTLGEPPILGEEEVLFQARLEESLDRQYDVTADGQRFVLNQASPIGAAPIVVTTDWHRLIKD